MISSLRYREGLEERSGGGGGAVRGAAGGASAEPPADGVGMLRGGDEHGESGGTPKRTRLVTESLQISSLVPGEWDYDGEKTCGGNGDGGFCETLWKKKAYL